MSLDDIERLVDNLADVNPSVASPFSLRPVFHGEVLKCIKSLRSDCSTGPDIIPARFIKVVADHLSCRTAHAQHQQLHKKLILPKILENCKSLADSKGKHASNKWRVPPDINTPCAIGSLRKVSGYPDVRICRGNVSTAWLCLKLPERSLHYNCATGYKRWY